ncbi:oxygen-independent coproporphyrinogen III oxidase [Psychromonas sp. psych-6C06]|uniref:oxygen-independent coproporphyrinogen III oxidase n=1 Tax=Psychromonas sp. psych-6C06 TaxID=2058089 RepID=UPI000C334176|nr:oxygen-independent coproporphyrinogen III oxidase [Psychromonas sp. psych-6C06]PKF61521.1 oxygen-independent coproporphyrinogen III oxidase [Psychromonas sp. psych-6C06]
MQKLVWDQALIEKYNYSGPRYTSYPTALEFDERFNYQDLIKATHTYPERPLSLYIHIPFCHKLCYFCGCNKTITRHQEKADKYLDYLEKEIQIQAPYFQHRQVSQLHWGGGTPTFLLPHQITRLMAMLRKAFTFKANAELSIEVDPREIELSTIDHLANEGFNRLSLGVQDFNKAVQKAVNREQDEAFIEKLLTRAREQGFQSTNLDMIYGLPLQTKASFANTLKQVLALDPARLSIFNYAHMPTLFAAQRKINEDDMPAPAEKLAMLQYTIEFLTQSGYQFIGMDHFAKPTDELAVAQQQGVLHRNFQGYTTQEDADLLGMGVSAISQIGHSYSQNQKKLSTYYSQIEEMGHAQWRGVSLNEDDLIRREVIKKLICNFKLDIKQIEQQFSLNFSDYFAEDIKLLQCFIDDQLVNIDDHEIAVAPKGRLLIRNICMCFDVYLRNKVRQQQFSRVI